MKQKPTRPPIANEAGNGLKNRKYTVAMARTGEPHSATAQFFINVADNDFLDHKGPSPQGWGYCVFGKVVEGAGCRRQDQGCRDRPQRHRIRTCRRRRRDPQGRGDRRRAPRSRRTPSGDSASAKGSSAAAMKPLFLSDLHLAPERPARGRSVRCVLRGTGTRRRGRLHAGRPVRLVDRRRPARATRSPPSVAAAIAGVAQSGVPVFVVARQPRLPARASASPRPTGATLLPDASSSSTSTACRRSFARRRALHWRCRVPALPHSHSQSRAQRGSSRCRCSCAA